MTMINEIEPHWYPVPDALHQPYPGYGTAEDPSLSGQPGGDALQVPVSFFTAYGDDSLTQFYQNYPGPQPNRWAGVLPASTYSPNHVAAAHRPPQPPQGDGFSAFQKSVPAQEGRTDSGCYRGTLEEPGQHAGPDAHIEPGPGPRHALIEVPETGPTNPDDTTVLPRLQGELPVNDPSNMLAGPSNTPIFDGLKEPRPSLPERVAAGKSIFESLLKEFGVEDYEPPANPEPPVAPRAQPQVPTEPLPRRTPQPVPPARHTTAPQGPVTPATQPLPLPRRTPGAYAYPPAPTRSAAPRQASPAPWDSPVRQPGAALRQQLGAPTGPEAWFGAEPVQPRPQPRHLENYPGYHDGGYAQQSEYVRPIAPDRYNGHDNSYDETASYPGQSVYIVDNTPTEQLPVLVDEESYFALPPAPSKSSYPEMASIRQKPTIRQRLGRILRHLKPRP
jgi:hypothetical protein